MDDFLRHDASIIRIITKKIDGQDKSMKEMDYNFPYTKSITEKGRKLLQQEQNNNSKNQTDSSFLLRLYKADEDLRLF